MTILIATMGERFALLSQDSWVTAAEHPLAGEIDPPDGPRGAITEDWSAAAVREFTDNGAPPPDVEPISFASKIIAVPHIDAIIGASGTVGPFLAFAANVLSAMTVGDVAELDAHVPNLLDQAVAGQSADSPMVVIALGWLAAEGRVAAFAYSRADGFASTPLLGGHSMMPVVDVEAAGYPAIRDAWAPALADPGAAARFHRLVARNQYDAWRAGRLRVGHITGIGGALVTARLDAEGIHLSRDSSVFRDGGGA